MYYDSTQLAWLSANIRKVHSSAATHGYIHHKNTVARHDRLCKAFGKAIKWFGG